MRVNGLQRMIHNDRAAREHVGAFAEITPTLFWAGIFHKIFDLILLHCRGRLAVEDRPTGKPEGRPRDGDRQGECEYVNRRRGGKMYRPKPE